MRFVQTVTVILVLFVSLSACDSGQGLARFTEPAVETGSVSVNLANSRTGGVITSITPPNAMARADRVDFQWKRNGEIISDTEYLYSGFHLYRQGDQASLVIRITTGNKVVEVESNTIVLIRTPGRTEITLSPEAPVPGDVISAEIEIFVDVDNDGNHELSRKVDAEALSYQWFKNDALITAQSGSSLLLDNAAISPAMGDRIRVNVDAVENLGVGVASQTVFVGNSPSELDTSNIPDVLKHSESAAFTIKFVDPDGTEVQTELIAGPQGLHYDPLSGLLRWTPRPIMFLPQERYKVIFKSSDGSIQAAELVVETDEQFPLLARGGVDVPKYANNIQILDFDGDGTTELLTTDSDNRVHSFEFDGQSYVQDLLYPFDITDNRNIVAVLPVENTTKQALVVTERKVLLIDDFTTVATERFESDRTIYEADYQDLNQDGNKDIILLQSGNQVQIVDGQSFTVTQTLSLPSARSETFSSTESTFNMVVGNVDEDPALEIVTSSGDVIDGSTGEAQWSHTALFGYVLATGDVNGDGINEIVAAGGNNREAVIYSAVSRAQLKPIAGIDSICDMKVLNVDDDPQEEIVIASCSSDPITVVDVAADEILVQHTIASRDSYDARNLTTGDLDDDGEDELVWATGTYTTGDRHIVTAALLDDGTASTTVKNENPAQYASAILPQGKTRTVHPVTGKPATLFVLGRYLGNLDDGGDIHLSDSLNELWYERVNTRAGVITLDSDNDGRVEMLYAAEGTSLDEVLLQRHIDDLSEIHTYDFLYATGSRDVLKLHPGSLEDGAPVALVSVEEYFYDDDSKLQVIDIQQRTQHWLSPPYAEDITYAEMYDVNGAVELLITTSSVMEIWRVAGDNYTLASTLQMGCHAPAPIRVGDETLIACYHTPRFSSDDKLSVFGRGLRQISESDIASRPHYTRAIAGAISDNLIAAFDQHLAIVDPHTGIEIWRSPKLLDKVNNVTLFVNPDTGNRQLAVGAGSVMYISR